MIARADRSPPPAPSWRFLSLPPGGSARVAVLARPEAVWVHWDGRTRPCTAAGCPCCARGLERRWAGAVLLRAPQLPGGPHVALFSAAAARGLWPHFAAGNWCDLKRITRERWSAEVVSQFPLPQPTPDVLDALEWLWRRSLQTEDVQTVSQEAQSAQSENSPYVPLLVFQPGTESTKGKRVLKHGDHQAN